MTTAGNREKDFQAAAEIGKIYNAFVDKKLLCEFFIDGVASFINAEEGYLFLAGNQDKLWLEATTVSSKEAPREILAKSCDVFKTGKNFSTSNSVYIPLVVRNSPIGVACFVKKNAPLDAKDVSLAADLSSQLAASLKNIFLFEENLRMEKLATIGQTMSAVMHELKNILQLGSLATEFLKMGMEKKNDKFLERGMDGVCKALKEMDGFTYEVLSLTKDYKIQPENVKLQTLLDELKTDVAPKADQWKIKMDFQAGEISEIQCEPRSLYRAFLNIVKNAMEACDENKEERFIRIRANSVDKEKYEVRIEDNGKGMSEEVKARIFQAFFSTKGEKGTGLGLLILDKTIKGHYGEIRVDSQLGRGTTFIITLPKAMPKV